MFYIVAPSSLYLSLNDLDSPLRENIFNYRDNFYQIFAQPISNQYGEKFAKKMLFCSTISPKCLIAGDCTTIDLGVLHFFLNYLEAKGAQIWAKKYCRRKSHLMLKSF